MDEKNEITTTTVQPRNIFQRMAAATEEINRVAKNLTVGVGRSAYKATGEADVLAAVKPAEARNGIYSYPVEREIVETDTLVSVDWEGKEKKQLFMRLRVVYRFVNVDNPGEYIDITSFGDGIDSGDKGTGKAMTYADKYALLKAYKIETGDDPDQHASDDLKSIPEKKEEKFISRFAKNFQKKFFCKSIFWRLFLEKRKSDSGNGIYSSTVFPGDGNIDIFYGYL